MIYRILADTTLVIHLAFIVFALLGALLVHLKSQWMFLHIPALAWGTAVECMQLECPLTSLENFFRHSAGQQGYQAGFIEHYLLPIIYPPGLDANTQVVLGTVLVMVNFLIYGLWVYRQRR